jgi:hypothetical protein
MDLQTPIDDGVIANRPRTPDSNRPSRTKARKKRVASDTNSNEARPGTTGPTIKSMVLRQGHGRMK